MIVYETDGFQVLLTKEINGWFVPLRWDAEMEDMVEFPGSDGWEVRFDTLDKAISYLAGK